ncbi:MAG: hypothetical protein ACOX50_03630 [Patescibacteria group bacterium]|jgi:hypothetical protein
MKKVFFFIITLLILTILSPSNISAQIPLPFSDDFENGTDKWATTGLERKLTFLKVQLKHRQATSIGKTIYTTLT